MKTYTPNDFKSLESNSANKNYAVEKMQAIINGGVANAGAVIDQVSNMLIKDKIVRGSKLNFGYRETESNGHEIITLTPDGDTYSLHQNAASQICEKVAMPYKYYETLTEQGEWGYELAANNFVTILQNAASAQKRYLLRSVDEGAPQLRGFLSERYRRIDSRPCVEAFADGCAQIGLTPIDGFALETKVRLRAVLPVIFEPVPEEFMIMGIEWGNSDFGAGGHVVNTFSIRVRCKNGLLMENALRQIHLGGRLSDDLQYSQETYELDTRANVAALKDTVIQLLNPARVETYLGAIKQAHEQAISPNQAKELFRPLLKREREMAIDAYNSPDVENLSAGNNKFRLINAITWVAQASEVKPERRLELEAFAGGMMPKVNTLKAVEV